MVQFTSSAIALRQRGVLVAESLDRQRLGSHVVRPVSSTTISLVCKMPGLVAVRPAAKGVS